MDPTADGRGRRLAEVARLFLWMGVASFGGPVAHLALMEEQVVRRRQWLTATEFLDLVGLTNLIPGPNSTEMAMAVGYRRAGHAGLVVAGLSFIVPAASITLVLAWAYVAYGRLPAGVALLQGAGPAVIAIMALAVVRLSGPAFTSVRLALLGAIVCGLALAGVDEVLLLIFGGAAAALTGRWVAAASVVALGVTLPLTAQTAAPAVTASPSLARLGAFFLEIGAVLYGGGYVLVALLQAAVDDHGWMTQRQLLDAVAAGQVTPGPVLTTATFSGYLMRGVPGAVVATVAIFLPAFVATSALGPVAGRLRRSPWARRALEGVSAAAVALMVAVTITLALRELTTAAAFVPLAVAGAVGLATRGSALAMLAAGMATGLALSIT